MFFNGFEKECYHRKVNVKKICQNSILNLMVHFLNFVNSDYEETLTSEKHLIEFYQGSPTQNKVAFGHPKMKLVARYLETFLPFSFVYFHRK